MRTSSPSPAERVGTRHCVTTQLCVSTLTRGHRAYQRIHASEAGVDVLGASFVERDRQESARAAQNPYCTCSARTGSITSVVSCWLLMFAIQLCPIAISAQAVLLAGLPRQSIAASLIRAREGDGCFAEAPLC